MSSSALRQASLYSLVLGLAACGAGDHSAPPLPTSPQMLKPAPVAEPVSSPGISMPVSSEGTKPAGFDAVFRVDPKPNTDGIIVGAAPLGVEFDVCGSSSGDDKPLTYLFDWDLDHVADATGTGDNCRQQHTYSLRHHPDATGHVLFETNVCVVSGDPRFHGPGTFFSCRKFKINLAVPTVGCADGNLPNTVPSSVSGSTAGESNDFTPSCASSFAPDVAYRFTAPATAVYTFDTFTSSYDTMLQVLDRCGGVEVACNDDTLTLQSQLSVPLTAGQSVIVVVDGFADSNGAYTLHVN